MKNWLQRVLEGRHGPDKLGQTLLVAGLACGILSNLRGGHWLLLLSYAALIVALARMLSRNHARRWDENQAFLKLWGRVSGALRGFVGRVRQSGQYSFFACPKCNQRLRVPRGRGKLEITCPKCGESFVKKT